MPVQVRGAVIKGTQVNSASPAALFAAGEQGVWFDPSDMSTMFQDAAGTTPVTAMEQPVGLVLDKSKGLVLGPELITNGDFSTNDLSLVTAVSGNTISVVNGRLRITRDGSTNTYAGALIQISGLVAGRSYRLVISCINGTLTSAHRARLNQFSAGYYGDNRYSGTYIFTSSGSTLLIDLTSMENNSSGFFEYDNISVRELPGNHAFQSTAASRPVLSARYNLLNQTETFDDVVWVKGGSGTITSSPGNLAPNGTLTADIWSQPAPTSPYLAQTSITVPTNTQFVASISIKKISGSWVRLFVGDSATLGAVNAFSCAFNLDSVTTGTPFTVGAGSTVGQCTITPEANGYYRIKIIGSLGSTSSVGFGLYLSDGDTLNRSSSSSCYIWGADLRVANDGVGIPAYQRVGAAVNTTTNPAVTGTPDYDTAGFPPYLKFDGIDDSMSTANINFSSTDKMSVWAGARKNLDTIAGFGFIAEFTSIAPNTDGSFAIFNAYGNPGWGFSTRGTIASEATTTSGYIAPITNVICGTGDISGDSIKTRINGSVAATSTADLGSGNYTSSTLYIGGRQGLNFFFNGRLYSLIVRGATTTDAQINAIETWTNLKTRAY